MHLEVSALLVCLPTCPLAMPISASTSTAAFSIHAGGSISPKIFTANLELAIVIPQATLDHSSTTKPQISNAEPQTSPSILKQKASCNPCKVSSKAAKTL